MRVRIGVTRMRFLSIVFQNRQTASPILRSLLLFFFTVVVRASETPPRCCHEGERHVRCFLSSSAFFFSRVLCSSCNTSQQHQTAAITRALVSTSLPSSCCAGLLSLFGYTHTHRTAPHLVPFPFAHCSLAPYFPSPRSPMSHVWEQLVRPVDHHSHLFSSLLQPHTRCLWLRRGMNLFDRAPRGPRLAIDD